MKRYTSFAGLAGLMAGFLGMAITLFGGRVTEIAFWHFVIGGVFIAVYFASRMSAFISVIKSRQARLGAFVSFYTIVVAAIIIVLNVIGAFTNVQVADLTEKGLFTLSTQTRKVLSSLNKDLSLKAFYRNGKAGLSEARETSSLLRSVDAFSGKISLEVIDPEKDILTAEKYAVFQDGTLVIEYNGQTRKINAITEETLTNAIIQLVDERPKTVCFTTGHGEPAITGNSSQRFDGIGKLRTTLETNSYRVQALDLKASPEIPSECTVVALVGPATPIATTELSLIDNFLNLGGRVLVAQDAVLDAGLNTLLQRWGAKLNDDIAVENIVEGAYSQGRGFSPTRMGATLNITVTSYNRGHPISQELTVNNPTNFIKARSVKEVTPADEKIKVTRLFSTKEDSWGENRIKETLMGERAILNPKDGDVPGPLLLSVAMVKNTQLTTENLRGYSRQARMVVVGNSSWLTNPLLDETKNYNSDLALNMIGWLAGMEEFLAIGSQSAAVRSLFLNYDQKQLLMNTTVILMPEIILILGLFVWWIRR